MLKYLVLILTTFTLNKKDKSAPTFQETFHFIISTTVYKLSIGLVITSTVIFSLIQFGQAAKIVLDKLENGLVLQILSFGSFTFIGLFILYLLLGRNQTTPASKKGPELSTIDLQALTRNFLEGIVEGYSPHEQNNQNEGVAQEK